MSGKQPLVVSLSNHERDCPPHSKLMADRSKSGFTPHQSSRRICNGQGQTAVRRLRLVGVHQRGLFAGIGAGFTLLEITISVAIMVLIVTVVFPQIGDIAKVQLHTSARRLAGTMRHVYFLSAMTKKNYVINYDLDKNEYWVGEAQYDPEAKAYKQIEVKRGIGRRRKLAPGIIFSSVDVAERAERSKGMELTFFSDLGVAEHTVVQLRDTKNREVRLELGSYGGRVKVGAP